MNRLERNAIVSLGAVFSFRMLGLFMVLPVLAIYSSHLSGSTPFLVGLALGAYGITQAILQIPFGLLSDRLGRKPVIIAGLLIFALGSLVAAYASSVYGVIVGRMLQGSGAIASTIMALLADLTTDKQRTRAMASIGMSIGVSFVIAVVLGPLVASGFGLSGLFASNAVLAIVGILLMLFAVPSPQHQSQHLNAVTVVHDLRALLKHKELLRLNLGIFVLHFVLIGFFVALPLSLTHLGVAPAHHGWIYGALLVASFFAMLPLVIRAEKRHKMKQTFCAAIVLLGISFFVLMVQSSHPVMSLLILGMFLFFMAFNLLEATLPSLVSKIAPAGRRGSAMGIYSTCQFSGAALGGALSGMMWQHWHIFGVAALCLSAIIIWAISAFFMQAPRPVSSLVMTLDDVHEQTQQQLLAIDGVQEAMVIQREKTVYLKVERSLLDESALQQLGRW